MISYEPLRVLLITDHVLKEKKINLRRMIDNKIITPKISVTLNNDTGYVNLSTIDKVMNYLSKELGRTVEVEEIIKFIPDTADPAGE